MRESGSESVGDALFFGFRFRSSRNVVGVGAGTGARARRRFGSTSSLRCGDDIFAVEELN